MIDMLNTIDLTPIIEALIGLLAALITYRLLPWLKAKLSAQQMESLHMATRTLVYAAEQIYGSKTGEVKLAWVEGQLEKRGFRADREAIEAYVKELGIYWPKSDESAMDAAQTEEDELPEDDEDTEPAVDVA